MTPSALTRSALVISTTPPIPREYGNRNRVYQTVQFLRGLGFTVSFLLYAFDEEWSTGIPPYYKELAGLFDYFAVIPDRVQMHQRAEGYHHTIDEWWDDAIGEQLTWLLKRKQFDVLFVNYTFLSKAFTFAPKGTLRILDTHDIFTRRREVFETYGVNPEFFYTNAEEERVAFDRADAIIAIKAAEGEFIRELTRRQVVTIPYWDNDPVVSAGVIIPPAPPAFSHDRPLRLGFIGAENSVNVVNMRRFLQRFNRYVRLYNVPVEIVIAGNVCRRLHGDHAFVRKLGRVEQIQDFYHTVDAVIAPLEFSTGIKIKVAEALVWKRPVLATHNAFDGFRSFHKTQSESSVAALCDAITAVAYNEIAFRDLQMAAAGSARAALRAQDNGFSDLQRWIKANTRRILFVTDRPFWRRSTFVEELVAQAIEYVSHIAQVIVVAIAPGVMRTGKVYAQAVYVQIEGTLDLRNLIENILSNSDVAGCVIYLDGQQAELIRRTLDSFAVPYWEGHIAKTAMSHAVRFKNAAQTKPVVVAPLRYAPLSGAEQASDTYVTIMVPDWLSDWENAVLKYIEDSCGDLGLQLIKISVGDEAENDEIYFKQVVTTSSKRTIIFASDCTSRLFLMQMAQYRGVGCQVIGEDFVLPEAPMPESNFPSLECAINMFLSGQSTGGVTTGSNVGWSKIWSALNVSQALSA